MRRRRSSGSTTPRPSRRRRLDAAFGRIERTFWSCLRIAGSPSRNCEYSGAARKIVEYVPTMMPMQQRERDVAQRRRRRAA